MKHDKLQRKYQTDVFAHTFVRLQQFLRQPRNLMGQKAETTCPSKSFGTSTKYPSSRWHGCRPLMKSGSQINHEHAHRTPQPIHERWFQSHTHTARSPIFTRQGLAHLPNKHKQSSTHAYRTKCQGNILLRTFPG